MLSSETLCAIVVVVIKCAFPAVTDCLNGRQTT